MTRTRQRVLEGLGVSPGIAIGKAVRIETKTLELYRLPLSVEEIDGEVERLEQAVEHADAAFVLGVQWHPERTGEGELGDGLFRQLTKACASMRPR